MSTTTPAGSDTFGSTTMTITTRRGISCDVVVMGPEDGPPVVSFHGAGGHLAGEPMLGHLAGGGLRVYAPVWPGYGAQSGEELLEDMLDFALHGADVVAALGLDHPHLVGHSFGGMVVGEMVALAPQDYDRVALVSPAGMWLDEHPIADIFAMLPFEFPAYLFHDPAAGASMMTGGLDFHDTEVIKAFLIGNSRRLGTVGKVMFPIPNRRLSKRLYRVTNEVLLVWGVSDRLIPPVYAPAWADRLANSTLAMVEEAGHMAPYEQPAAVAGLIGGFFSPSS